MLCMLVKVLNNPHWFEKLKVPHCCADYNEFVSGVANNKL